MPDHTDARSATNVADPRIVAGMAAQGRRRRQAIDGGATPIGWKAGMGTAEVMRRTSLATAIVGFLTDATRLPDGARVDIAGWSNPKFEPELAVRIGRDLDAGADERTAAAAIDAIAPAIELVDLVGADDIEAALAGNVFHRAVLVGSWLPSGAEDGAAARLRVTDRGDELAADVDPARALGSLVDVVRALADQVPLSGELIRAGDVIMTGSTIPAVDLAGGERLEVTLQGGGSVSVTIAEAGG